MFDAGKYYLITDPALRAIASPATLRRWKRRGEGPAYTMIGIRIAYSGAALNAWLEARTVRPANEHVTM